MWKFLATTSSVVWASSAEKLGRGFLIPNRSSRGRRGTNTDPLLSFHPPHPRASHLGTSASFSPQRQEECQECKCVPRCWPGR